MWHTIAEPDHPTDNRPTAAGTLSADAMACMVTDTPHARPAAVRAGLHDIFDYSEDEDDADWDPPQRAGSAARARLSALPASLAAVLTPAAAFEVSAYGHVGDAAERYMEHHGVRLLFEELTAGLYQRRPPDPLEYVAQFFALCARPGA